jgi:hypothetical protein
LKVHKQPLLLLSLILLLLSVAGCKDSQLKQVAKNMQLVATTISIVQTDAVEANKSQLIDDATTAKILSVCTKVNAAGKQIDSVLRSIQTLDVESRTKLMPMLTAVSNSLDPTQIEFVAGIKNPVTKQKVEGGFTIARSTISAIQLQIAINAPGGK